MRPLSYDVLYRVYSYVYVYVYVYGYIYVCKYIYMSCVMSILMCSRTKLVQLVVVQLKLYYDRRSATQFALR